MPRCWPEAARCSTNSRSAVCSAHGSTCWPRAVPNSSLTLRTELLQQNGFAHGGVVSYLADNALTYAGGSALGLSVVTSEFKINYVRPAIGERLIARAEAVALSRSQVVCRCDVLAWRGGEEKLCAVAQGTIVRLVER